MSAKNREKRIARARVGADMLRACGYEKEADDVVALCLAHVQQGVNASNLWHDNQRLRERLRKPRSESDVGASDG